MAVPEASRPAVDDPDRPAFGKRIEGLLGIVGCLAVVGTILFLAAWGLRVLGPWWLLALCIGLIAGTIHGVIVVHNFRNRRAARRFHDAFGPLGKDLLLVTSDSPHWKEHIERNWLARWGNRAVVINWSERSRWLRARPEVALFRRLQGECEYNPLAIVVGPGGREFVVVEFWRAFRDLKHGKPARLDAAEARLAALLEALDQGRTLRSVPPGTDPDERRESLRRAFKERSGAKSTMV